MTADMTLHHRVRLDRSGPQAPCVWCGKPTDIRALTPFRPDIGQLPLHLFCGAFMRDAYRKWQAGVALDTDEQMGMRSFGAALLQLTDGKET